MSPTRRLSASRTPEVINTGTGLFSPPGTTVNRVGGWYANCPPGITSTARTAAKPVAVVNTGVVFSPGAVIAQSPLRSAGCLVPSAFTTVSPSTWRR